MKTSNQKELNEMIAKIVEKYISAETGETYKKCCDLAIPIQIAVHSTIDTLIEFGLIDYKNN